MHFLGERALRVSLMCVGMETCLVYLWNSTSCKLAGQTSLAFLSMIKVKIVMSHLHHIVLNLRLDIKHVSINQSHLVRVTEIINNNFGLNNWTLMNVLMRRFYLYIR